MSLYLLYEIGQDGFLRVYQQLSAGQVQIDTNDARKRVYLGAFVKATVLTSGSTFTTGATTNTIRVRLVGAGGNGAAATGGISSSEAGGGGGAGAYAEKVFAVTPNTGYGYTVGTTVNSSSLFIVGAVQVTAGGGSTAPAASLTSTSAAFAGGAGGTATNGDINVSGESGDAGLVLLGTSALGLGGNGGSSPFGGGGPAVVTASNGNAATGFGSGGGGAFRGSSGTNTAGSFAPGCIIVEEYQ